MDLKTGLIFAAVTTLALSYGWGMRGTVIGGEKGAMLPGALLGIMLARFSGSAVVMENYWVLASVGLMGMSFGGIEPYGETIGMVLHRGESDYHPHWGRAGLALKGAQWFSVCAGFLAMAFSAMAGTYYKWYDIIVFFAALPFIEEAGYRIFNKPYDKLRKIYPKIYFSRTRREEWGRNAAVIVALILLAAFRADSFTLVMLAGGFTAGGIGWYIAIKAYELSVFPLQRNGKYLLGRLYKCGAVDGWKTMEFTLGAVGGLGVALCFCAAFDMVSERTAVIEANGSVWCAFGGLEKISPWVIGAAILAVVAINLYQSVAEKRGKEVNTFLCDVIERPLYNVLPMALVMLGSVFTARIMTFFMLFFVCAVKCAFDRFTAFKALPVWQALLMLSSAAVFAGDIILGGYTARQTWLLAGAPYLLAEFMWVFAPSRIKKLRSGRASGKRWGELLGGELTVYPFFIAQIIALYIIGSQIF